MNIEKVVVIGGGVMGKQIALNSAISGYKTTLNDMSEQVLENVDAWSKEYLTGRVAKGKMTEEQKNTALKNFTLEKDLASCAKDCDLVIEAIVERLDIKLNLFKQLDELTPSHAILASNSSTWVPSVFAEATKRPEKVINIHYFNPALKMELVEIVLSESVSEETIESMKIFSEKNNKKAITVQKEIDGFVVNNILNGINKVAWMLLEEGYASAQDIDLGAEKGLGHPMGPFRLLDLIGLDTVYDIRMNKYKKTGNEAEKPSELLAGMVQRGELGRKSGRGFYDYSK